MKTLPSQNPQEKTQHQTAKSASIELEERIGSESWECRMGCPELVRTLEMTNLRGLFFTRLLLFTTRNGPSGLAPAKQVFYHRAVAELVIATLCRALEKLLSCSRIYVSLSSLFAVIKWFYIMAVFPALPALNHYFPCLFFAWIAKD